MIAHSNNFKTSITDMGREIDARITYYGSNGYLATQDDKLVLTEDDLKILMEEDNNQQVRLELNGDDIYRLEKNNLGELFRTYMKSFDLETPVNLQVGSYVKVEIGCKVNGTYEYLDYGKYIVYTKEYNEDTKTYNYQLCDNMIKTMVPFKWDDIVVSGGQVLEQTTLYLLTRLICQYCHIGSFLQSSVNRDNVIYKKTFDGINLTCRDVLDMCAQASGMSLMIDPSHGVVQTSWNRAVVDTINEDNLKDTNVKFVNKFGPLNSLVFSRLNGSDNLAIKDDQSIAQYGETQYVIDNNLILEQDNRSDYLQALFNQMKDLEYYECNLDLVGLEYIEYLDRFNVQIGDNTYGCICLKNTSSIQSGLTENITSEKPIEKKEEYVKEGLDDKKASIMLDKANGQIVLKTDSNGKIAQVRLDSSADTGSQISIASDQIDLSGKNINLTSDNITISSTKFNVTKDGDVTCSNISATGGSLALTGPTQSSSKIKVTSESDSTIHTSIYPSEIRFEKSGVTTARLIGGQTNSGQLALAEVGTGYQTNISARSVQTPYVNGGNIDSGSCTLNSSSETWVPFNKTFDYEPRVVVTPNTSASGVIAPKVRSVYTTGFNAILGGSGFSNVNCSWIALR